MSTVGKTDGFCGFANPKSYVIDICVCWQHITPQN